MWKGQTIFESVNIGVKRRIIKDTTNGILEKNMAQSCCWQKITRVIPRSDIPFQEEWLWQQKISTFTDFTLQYKSSSKMVLFTNCGYWKFSTTALGPHQSGK